MNCELSPKNISQSKIKCEVIIDRINSNDSEI